MAPTKPKPRPTEAAVIFDELAAEFRAGQWDDAIAAEAAKCEPTPSPSDGE